MPNVGHWHVKRGTTPRAFRNVQTLDRIHPNPYYVRATDFPQLVLCGMEQAAHPREGRPPFRSPTIGFSERGLVSEPREFTI
ncbi:hypothetical protein SDC9_198029 [bioreactor metagenome]|uniref:Uncharacterized protein n=1 Tax=bioreactor metagenome TaxID=1076179 RepID=A0A645ITC2_9ZZZZ